MVDTTRLLQDLVRLPSINPMGRDISGPDYLEHQVTKYLEEIFRELGAPYVRQTVAPLRDNIIARYEPPGASWTLLFEVHQDTVPAEKMVIPPFGAQIEGDKLYGRGACDVKGGMAAMLAAFSRLVRERPARSARVLLACTVDEEHTFLGVQRLVQEGIRADMAVVAEPTCLHVVHAHKGVARWFVETFGRSCHSSAPERGENAIYRMATVLNAISTYAQQLQSCYGDPLLGSATLSVGRIEGGTSANVVPDYCRAEIDRRLLPGENPDFAPQQLEEFVRGLAPQVNFRCSPLWLKAPALAPALSAEAIRRVGQAIDGVLGSHQVHAVPYGTDASTLAEAGIPSVVFGPGDIAQAHTCDEWVSLVEVEQASEILYRLALSA